MPAGRVDHAEFALWSPGSVVNEGTNLLDDSLTQLILVWNDLGNVEKRVILRIATRLRWGQDAYGVFGDKDKDKNWYREIQEEAMDASVYVAAMCELARVN